MLSSNLLILVCSLQTSFGIYINEPSPTRQAKFFNFQKLLSGTKTSQQPFLQNRITDLLAKITSFENISAQLNEIDGIASLVKYFEQKRCPPATNSFPVKDKCYQHVNDLWMSYDDAQAYCQARGGQLVRPKVKDPYFFKNLKNIFPTIGYNSVLVGITDILKEGTFTYMDGTGVPAGTVLKQETSYGKNERDCVSLSSRNGFTLRDVVCKFRHEFICEYDLVNLLPTTQ